MTKTKWCVIQKTKTKSKFVVKINTATSNHQVSGLTMIIGELCVTQGLQSIDF